MANGRLSNLRVLSHPKNASLLLLGFSAGLPYMLVFATLSFWLREAGMAKDTITRLSWVGLLFGFKWAWAPALDHLPIPVLRHRLGRRRSWLIVAQTGIGLALLGLSTQNPSAGIQGFVLFALLLAFFAATQDIAIDAYRIECAPNEQQGMLAAAYQAGYRLAMLLGSAGALGMAAGFSAPGGQYHLEAWQLTYKIMAACVLPGVFTTLVITEPAIETKATTVPNVGRFIRTALVSPLLDFFNRFGRTGALVLLIIGLYRLSDIVMGVIANPFYVDMGFSKGEVAFVSKVFGVGMTLLGATTGGLLLAKIRTGRVLLAGAILAAATNLLFAWLAIGPADVWRLILAIAADNFCGGLASAAFIAFLSGLTSCRFSATQYALFSSLMSVFPKLIAGFSGTMVNQIGYPQFFVATALMGLPVILLLLHYNRRHNKP